MKQALLSIGIGIFLAFLLNLPMSALEKGFRKLWERRGKTPPKRALRTLSFLTTLLLFFLLLTALGFLVVPELLAASEDIRAKMVEYYAAFTDYLAEKGSDGDSLLGRFFLSIDGDALIDRLFDRLDLTLQDLVELAFTTFSWLSTLITSLFFALYALAGKEKLIAPIKRLTYALLPQTAADRLSGIAEMTRASFVRFFSGQCIEAMVLGVLIYIAFLLFGIPYAMVVATLTAICALIPYVGAFLSCAVGVLLSLLESPQTALLCLVVYLSIQFIESELIYPHVVGASVGLSPLWTLIAALVGECLFGIVGMVLFIPLIAVLYALAREALHRRLDQKGLSAVYIEEEAPPRAPEIQKSKGHPKKNHMAKG